MTPPMHQCQQLECGGYPEVTIGKLWVCIECADVLLLG